MNENKLCLCCGNEILIDNIKPSEYQMRKFCSRSCAAKYNNKNFPKKISGKKKESHCVHCGDQLSGKQTKFCSVKCQHEYQQNEWEKKWFSGEINGFYETDHWGNIPNRIRTYLFKKFDAKCAQCGWGEVNPFTGRIPLEVEHIDGDFKNNRPENVTLLCPNCHSLTNTYRGANRGKGRGKTWVPADNKN